MSIITFNSQNNPMGKSLDYSHFTDEESKDQRGQESSPKSLSIQRMELGFKPLYSMLKILLYAAPTDHVMRGHLIQKENTSECTLQLIFHIKYRKSQQLFTLLNGRERILLFGRQRWKGTFLEVIISISVIPNIIILWERMTLMTSYSQPPLIKQEPTQISIHQNASCLQLLKLYFWKKKKIWKQFMLYKVQWFFFKQDIQLYIA